MGCSRVAPGTDPKPRRAETATISPMMHYSNTEMLVRERRRRLLDDAERARALRRVPRRVPWYVVVLYGR